MRPHRLGPPPPSPPWSPGMGRGIKYYQDILVSVPRIADLYASNIGSLCLEYRISMPRISDLYASDIGSISMPRISDIYASNIGSLCLEYRISASNIGSLCLEHQISMPRISDIYASSIEFLRLEHTFINICLKNNSKSKQNDEIDHSQMCVECHRRSESNTDEQFGQIYVKQYLCCGIYIYTYIYRV